MVVLDIATGLRCSELLALKWCDVNWSALTVSIRRAIVDAVVDDVKTKSSKAGLPLDPDLAELLMRWRSITEFNRDEDWVFASPFQAGQMPYRPWGIQQRRIRPAAIAAGLGNDIGWHTFRHTFRTLLDEMERRSKCNRNSCGTPTSAPRSTSMGRRWMKASVGYTAISCAWC